MLSAGILAENSFELWPGLLHLVACGRDAHAAVEAGMDVARETAADLVGDAELVARGSLDVLPRGLAARQLLEAARALVQASGAAGAGGMSPLIVALPGSVCDRALAAMRDAGSVEFAAASLGDSMAFHLEAGADMPVIPGISLVLGEFVGALGASAGGVAMAGLSCAFPTSGVADRVAAQAQSASHAALAAATIADDMRASAAKRRLERIGDPLVARAWKAREITGNVGLLAPEEIRNVLSAGVRRASVLRERHLLRAAALALKGRGRTLGRVDGDRLLRFGVSEWR